MRDLNLQNLKYVVFDWDNTLADSRPALVTIVNQVLAEYHLPPWPEASKRRCPGISFRDNFSNIFGPERAKVAYERYASLYLNRVSELVKTFPYVPEVLEIFADSQIPILIMSNKDRRLLEAELPLLFNPRLFTRIICGHEAIADKPQPDQLYYSLRGLLKPEEITPDNTWMIGDSPEDSACALAAGARALRINQPIWDEDSAPNPQIDSFRNFEEFYQYLRRELSLLAKS